MNKEINLDDLKELLIENANNAEKLYSMIKNIDKNLFNEQFVMDWQDRLNKVSITQKEDVI